MQRDGFCPSLWQEGMETFSVSSVWDTTQVYDVLIVGGGITGLTTALLLQQAGLRCLLAEAHNLGFGTSGGTTAHLNTFLDSPYHTIEKNFGANGAQLVAKGCRDAISLIKKHIETYGIDCGYAEVPGYIFTTNPKQNEELDKIMQAANKVGVAMNYSDHLPVAIPNHKIVRTETQAQFHPMKYLYRIAGEFEANGGVIVQHSRVTMVNKEAKGLLSAMVGHQAITVKRVVYATHIPPGVNAMHFLNAPYRSYAMAFSLKDDAYPDAVVYDMEDPYHYYRTQEVGGRRWLIAGGEDHKTGHEPNTEARFRSLEAYVRHYFDIDEIGYRWSSQYFESADGLPFIGHLPGGHEGEFVATGFGGNGMILGTLSGIVLADIIAERESAFESLFSPSRMKPVASFKNVVKESTDVIVKYFTGLFSVEKLDTMLELAPGEAKVIEYEGHKLAAYRDENNELHLVNPVCPHAKCTVSWNNAERTWDCPCHGSRFSIDGEAWTGPTDRDLSK